MIDLPASSKLSLGTAQFGLNYGIANQRGQVSLDEAQFILSLARENEIDVLDTAISYGTCEEVLGKVGVDGFRVVTKLPSLPVDQGDIGGWVRNHVEASLGRLRQEKLYGLLLHRSQDLLGSKDRELMQALADLKDADIVQKIGVSIYNPDELDEIHKKVLIDLVQAPLNIIDRRMETSGWLNRLKDDGVEVHARSVFLQGLLLMEQSKIPEEFSRWSRLWEAWHEKLRDSGALPLETCLAYPLSLQEVDQVIVGVNSIRQLQDILTAASGVDRAIDASFMMSTDANLINPSNWNRF